jgi:4-oxalocrotonate tautomerase
VIVKVVAGKTEGQKIRLAEIITQDVTSIFGVEADAVSVAIEEVARPDWAEKVYKPDIAPNLEALYKKPGYTI